jgi:hypothetical protein
LHISFQHSISEYCRILNTLPSVSIREGGELGGASQVSIYKKEKIPPTSFLSRIITNWFKGEIEDTNMYIVHGQVFIINLKYIYNHHKLESKI